MGRIVISETITVDGVVQDPTGDDGFERGGWFNSIGAKDREAWVLSEFEEAQSAEALLMGRRSYEYFMARGWGSRTSEWADRLRSLPKYVVSSTLDDLEWANSTVLRGDVVTEVSKLKEAVDGDIVVYASGRLVPVLMEHGLVDELRLMVYPCIAGAGDQPLASAGKLRDLQLIGSRRVGDGLVLLSYGVLA
ncbi:dihydrofolate reductase family protein [Kribbella monticola]|uniref:dihydrofolate reductase family protein n=1 Tax=Kribbella monticola TaxID=2185285 RepID=UPI000DD2BA36|nr:dihydrofolate reductase family protein [Kribbella monticola]